MSLQVWLPLNGDLHNQGLSDITVTNNGATVNSAGKIGSCYEFNDSKNISLTDYVAEFLTYTNWSISLWFKCTAQNTVHTGSALISSGNWNYPTQLLQFSLGYFSSDHYTKLLITNTSSWSNGYSYNFYLNTWYHVVLVSGNNKMSAYVNGELIGDSFSAYTPVSSAQSDVGIGKATYNGSMPFYGLMNDIRIYNHALSIKEVKELSKGLVLHYKLDDTYSENSTFLSSSITNTAYNAAIGKYGYNETSNLGKVDGYFNGKYCTKVYTLTAGETARPYAYFGNLFTSNGTNAPAYKTLSFDYFTTVPTTTWLNIYKLGSGEGTATWTTTSNTAGVRTGTYTNSANSILIQPNEWNHVIVILHGTTDANAEWGYCINGPNHTTSADYYFLYANIQLEENDHATGYGANMHSNIIYDSSGYSNNGTIVGSLETITPSPRYGYATKFDGTSSTIKVTNNSVMAQGAPAMTINLWAKASTWPTTGRLFSCTESGGFNLQGGNSGYWRFSIHVYTNAEQTSTAYKYDSKEIQISALPTDEWVMLTCVYDSTGTKTYINGELHHTYSNVSYGIHFNTNARLFLGCEANGANPSSPYYNGQMSDFRLYYTALTPEQIKELYNTSMSIDNNGNIHARELVEL